ncbi:LacI family DNA-binding transcriptional regulator [Martelella lutilitoris]|uniref:LacI family DNA-binding transcriptional regulator n=1 Tax=Martelella lutilitoris TaxID=2583532 RepID=A0A7T7HJP2_9HYPH|nr:LacI family DNA-binding transcriptional regulator [Martelella lutilitoris]QQM30420.1 LacI family DNA-binding transcriptional regulator [Martelella lutilitoris]
MSETMEPAHPGKNPNAEDRQDATDTRPARSSAKLTDVAAAAGVSLATASKALNNRRGVSRRNRDAVLRAAQAIGYLEYENQPPRTLPSTVTLFTYGRMVGNDAFYGDIIDGIVSEATAQGVTVEVSILDEALSKRGERSWKALPKAAILMGIDEPRLLEEMQQGGIPGVLVNGIDQSMNFPSVAPDYYFGGWAATRHLLELGHTEILHVTHVYRVSIAQREIGFRDALESAGITFDHTRHILDLGSTDMISMNAGPAVAKHLAGMERRPTALFCVSDVVAMSAIQAIRDMGLSVPDDISVVGFDGLPIGAHAMPSLTTVGIDRRELGIAAVKLLAERASFPDSPAKRISIGVELLNRQSTAPARKG